MQLFAKTTDGGKANVEQRVLSTKAVAKVVRKVVIDTGGIATQPYWWARARGKSSP